MGKTPPEEGRDCDTDVKLHIGEVSGALVLRKGRGRDLPQVSVGEPSVKVPIYHEFEFLTLKNH